MSAELPVTPRHAPSRARGTRHTTPARPIASRIGRVVAALVSTICLLVTGVGWTLFNGLSSDLTSAGGLNVGDGGLDGAVDILLVGTDNRTDAQGKPLSQEELDTIRTGEDDGENTDTILLIRIPEDGSSATAISIPRDVYVETSSVGGSKINGVYAANKEAYLERAVSTASDGALTEQDQHDAVKAGRNGLIGAVRELTGVQADHYAEIGLLGFVLLTDAVGGVPVCLNESVNEPLSGANFRAGVQTVSGSDALSFVRQRHDLPAGDLDRIVRQQAFMSQLVKKILSAGTLADPSKLGALVDAAKRSFVIDENWDFVDFAMKLQDISGGSVRFETIPVTSIDSYTEWGESIVTADPAQVSEFVAGFASTEDDDAAGPEQTPTSTPGVNPASITVSVVNTTSIDGLASQVSGSLTELGYKEGDLLTDPAAAYTSHVAAASADDAAAFAVSDALGGLPVQVDPAVPAGSVRVVLAEDYSGPTGDAVGIESYSPTTDTYEPLPPSIAERPTFDAGGSDVPCVN
ncbi:LCP family protein [Dietzia sp. ANT_WB102]|uniref:LCP family protein n=1 Tax=Dietzia sp. ANT_WB102 TaxID=2597345 RepID=UPI0011ED2F54|nr:LCP family protein [Dietzia sp. ANT_WB102]KAA0917030.1 LytR family transcriptional regulator [Dietzia sp. ANT_WB102]